MAMPLRLGAIPTLAPYLLPRLVPIFQERWPQGRLVLHEGRSASLLEDLEQGRIDGALMALPFPTPGCRQLVLAHEDFYLAVPEGHPFCDKGSIR